MCQKHSGGYLLVFAWSAFGMCGGGYGGWGYGGGGIGGGGAGWGGGFFVIFAHVKNTLFLA